MKKIVTIVAMFTVLPLLYSAEKSPDAKGFYMDIAWNRLSGIYKCGEKAEYKALLMRDKKPVSGLHGRYIVKFEGKIIRTQPVTYNGTPISVVCGSDKPGWVYVGFEIYDKDGKPISGKNGVFIKRHGLTRFKPTIVGEIGAMFDPEKITEHLALPKDFDQFWQQQRAELDKVPVKAKLTPVEVPQKFKNQVKCYSISIDCAGSKPVTGYLALPTNLGSRKVPALVDYLSWVSQDAIKSAAVSVAAKGVIALFATWHGLPSGRDSAFYQKNVPLEAPIRSNLDSREKCYLRQMCLRVMRAMDYVKSRPEWDGRQLIIQGGSLGGYQAIAACALDPDVTLGVIGVPVSDLNGYLFGRPLNLIPNGLTAYQKQVPRAATEAMAYYDPTSFASRIKCEVFVCTGFTDETCHPSGVWVFYNNLPPDTRKTMSTDPVSGHYGTTKNLKGENRLRQLFSSITVY